MNSWALIIALEWLDDYPRYNLLPSGSADRRTLHGACPVLYGTKWGKNTYFLKVIFKVQ